MIVEIPLSFFFTSKISLYFVMNKFNLCNSCFCHETCLDALDCQGTFEKSQNHPFLSFYLNFKVIDSKNV